jgi:hypothetical protein
MKRSTMRMYVSVLFLGGFLVSNSNAQQKPFNGLHMSMGNLSRLSDAQTRSISAENFTGEKGKAGMTTEGLGKNSARDLGRGWKISPAISLKARQTFTLAEIKGPGAIQQMWFTPTGHWRFYILRMYWDDEKEPSVECPIGDFFACGWGEYAHVSSLAVCVNPGSAFNCYWPMPFRKSARITVENISEKDETLFYQINYTLTDIPEDEAYFHAQFRRVNPLPYKDVYTIVDGIKGKGQYVGTYMTWQTNNVGWWGEGEIKFYMDGDEEFPTICGTGTEDYFCGSYCFVTKNKEGKDEYREYTTPYAGMPQVIRPDGLWKSQTRFGLYRWHIMDPVRFEKDLKVTMQALGWRSGGRYLPLQDDIGSVAFWYQTEPHAKFPKLPDKDHLEVN